MHALFFAVALAAATGPAQSDRPAPKRIDIDDDEVVEGGVARADGEALFAKRQAQFGSLIRLRADFRPELLKSGE